jgi:hypothetical protein
VGAGAVAAAGPVAAATHLPGAEWIGDDGVYYRRSLSGKLQRRMEDAAGNLGRWVFTSDPTQPISAASLARRARHQRKKEGRARKLGEQAKGTGIVPFAVTQEDRLRIKLRDRARKVMRGEDAAAFELPTLPGVHALDFATRYIDGGRPKFVEFVQLAMLEGHTVAERWYAVFADLTPYEREKCSLDDVCAASGVKPSQLMSAIVSTVMDVGRDAGNLIAAMTHPQVVARAVESALRIDGEHAEIAFKDRQALFQHQNFVPTPRGTTVNVNASASAKAAAAAAGDPSVPKFGVDMRKVGGSTTQAALPAATTDDDLPAFLRTPVAVPVTVTVDDDDE